MAKIAHSNQEEEPRRRNEGGIELLDLDWESVDDVRIEFAAILAPSTVASLFGPQHNDLNNRWRSAEVPLETCTRV